MNDVQTPEASAGLAYQPATGAAGRVTVRSFGQTYRATWRVLGSRVEVASQALGTGTAPLGQLRSAPASVAREKLTEMAMEAARSVRHRGGDAERFNVREAGPRASRQLYRP